jgi:hypothetical protein
MEAMKSKKPAIPWSEPLPDLTGAGAFNSADEVN